MPFKRQAKNPPPWSLEKFKSPSEPLTPGVYVKVFSRSVEGTGAVYVKAPTRPVVRTERVCSGSMVEHCGVISSGHLVSAAAEALQGDETNASEQE